MASFQKYNTKNKTLWMFKLDVGVDPQTGKRRTTTRRGFNTKKEAQTAAAQLEQELLNGTFITQELTYQEAYEQWLANHEKTIKTSTRKSIDSKFKRHILPHFGKLKLKDISRAYCQKVINEVAEKINSVNDIKIQANQVFKYALKMELITRNPMEHVSVPRRTKELVRDASEAQERTYWRKDEIRTFLSIAQEEMNQRDYVLFHLMIYTGARKGELLALTWDDIDLTAGSIRFSKTLFQHDGHFTLQTPKTRESKRLISLDSKSIALLKKWRVRQKESLLAASDWLDDHNMVFTRDDGSPIRLAYPNEKLEHVVKKHNLHRITIHGLRHTHASLLFEAGASIKEVQERLGHSDIQMTMNIYTHVTDTVKEQTAEKFQRYMEL